MRAQVSDFEDKAVTIKEAASLAKRSTSWVRTHRDFGPLVPAVAEGRQGVTLASLNLLLAQVAQRRRKPSSAPCLWLIVDNTDVGKASTH